GDNVNPKGAGNPSPLHLQRNIDIELLDAKSNVVASQEGALSYVSSTGNFTGTMAIGNLSDNTYTIQIGSTGFLRKLVPGFIQTQQGKQYTVPTVYLTTGDANNDNQLDIQDYNILISCYGRKQGSVSCINTQAPDFNDDGFVNGVDYNV